MTRARRAFAAEPRRLLWDAFALAGCVALAAVSAWEVYGTWHVGIVAAVGLAIATGSVLLGAVLGWRWWAIGLAALGGYLLAVVPIAMPDALSSASRFARAEVDGISGIVVGWKQLLTISLPAGGYQGVLVPFLVTVLACSLAAFSLMLFSPSRYAFAVAPMLAMVAFGAAFGSSQATDPLAVGSASIADGRRVSIAFLAIALCVVWLLGRARIERSSAVRAARSSTGTARLGAMSLGFAMRRQGAAFAIVAAAIAGTVLLAPLAASLGTRIVPRDSTEPVLVLREQPSPLSDYRRYFATAAYDTPLFAVDGAGETDRLRIATLDDYDGQTYRIAADTRFTRQPLAQAREVTVTIAEGYRGIWVPLATAQGGAPRFIGSRAELLADAYYANADANAGVVVLDGEGSGLLVGDAYAFAASGSPGTGEIASAGGGDSRIEPEDYPQLTAWVEEQGLGRSGADLLALVERLRERGYLSHASRQSTDSQSWTSALQSRADYIFQGSRPGHSAARVDELFAAMLQQERRAGEFASPDALVAAIGDDEQFATAAALLASYLGFDSRVVLGVRLGSAGEGLGVEPCDSVCTGSNVTVWTEVRSPSGDWVALDATPQFEVAPLLIQEGQTPPQNPTEPEQAASDVVEPPVAANDATATDAEATTDDPTWLDRYLPAILTLLVATAGLVVLVAPFLVFPTAKRARRRWRRRNRVPEVAMVGAWDELVDTYVDFGIAVPHALTRAETADVLGRPAAATIAATVDRAVFAEHRPTAEASEDAWRLFDAERRALATTVPWRRRLRARLTPASLVRDVRRPARIATPTLLRKDRRDLL